jgi:hypothetical protein
MTCVKASSNYCTAGIEMFTGTQGNFAPDTLYAAVELTVKLLDENYLF